MDIRKHIKELLFTHDCVIIPGFGGFVTSYQSSEIQRFKNVVYPPSKSLLFNRRLQTNDGVLISRIAQEEKIDYKTAEEKVRQSAETWNRQIDNKGTLMFPDIGKVYINSSNALVFLPELRKNYLTDTFGLKPIAYHLVSTDSPSAKIVKMERKPPPPTREDFVEDDSEMQEKRGKRMRITVISAAAAIILLFLIPQLFLQNMLPTNLRIHQLNVMPLFGDSSAAEIKTPKKEMIRSAEENTSAESAETAAPENSETAEASIPSSEDNSVSNDASLPSSGNFYVIFGEADFISDAIRIKKQLDGEHSKTFEVFTKDGTYVVGLPAGSSKEEAQTSLNQYSASNSNLRVVVRE